MVYNTGSVCLILYMYTGSVCLILYMYTEEVDWYS